MQFGGGWDAGESVGLSADSDRVCGESDDGLGGPPAGPDPDSCTYKLACTLWITAAHSCHALWITQLQLQG